MQLSDRDWRALLWGGAIVAILLLYLLFFRGGDSSPSAEPVQADIAATMPAGPPATYATPIMPSTVAAPVAVASAPSVDVSQLRLFGLLSRGAVIGTADGTQHFVPIGREIVPGVRLTRIEVHHAILATNSGEVRLGFDSAAQAPPAIQPSR